MDTKQQKYVQLMHSKIKASLVICNILHFPFSYIFKIYVISRENDKENVSRHQQMKESISMGQIQATGNYPDAVPAKMLGGLNNGNKGTKILKTYTYCYYYDT